MKNILHATLLALFISVSAQAQLRSDLATPYDYTGPIINQNSPTVQNKLNQFFSSIQMSHSYSMSFTSFGGSYQNVNAYTNTMQFALSERMTGRVDVSFLHSPFGGNGMTNMGNFQNQVILRNAELNYKINDKAFIHVSYQRHPGFGMGPFGNRFGPRNRFNNNWMWY